MSTDDRFPPVNLLSAPLRGWDPKAKIPFRPVLYGPLPGEEEAQIHSITVTNALRRELVAKLAQRLDMACPLSHQERIKEDANHG